MNQEIVVTVDGQVLFVHDDDLAGLGVVGEKRIYRVSHVEPTADCLWQADMSPLGGDVLGPFELKGDALDAERAWVQKVLRGR